MISFDKASQLIFEAVEELGPTTSKIEDAVGHALYEDIVSPLNVAPFRNSAMDGFAVRSEWLTGCSDDNPITLPIENTIFAGDAETKPPRHQHVTKVMTGAPVPKGYDTVVKFEDTSYDDRTAVFTKPAQAGENIRLPGEDITQGQLLFRKRHVVQALDIGILASIGLSEVSVFRKPKVLAASTGNELVPPGEPLGAGKIYNSNGYTIAALIRPFSSAVDQSPILSDDDASLQAALSSDHNVIVTSGGVSAGERDNVIKAAESCGWTTIFHKIRIKPGKPVYFAHKGKQLLFGVPGNPLSTAVTCCVFVIPALKKMAGYRQYELCPAPARLSSQSARKGGRTLIWPGMIRQNGSDTVAEFSPKTSSAALSAVLDTDGLIFQDAPRDSTSPTVKVEVVRWQQIFER